MKTSIWAACPKCQSELKIETDETELVQIECPDCNKVFAAKVPPRATAPQRDVFAQAPILPPFQPAHVHYQSRPNRSRSRQSDDSLHPLALTALILVCAGAIVIPMGFGAYYIYGKLTETSEIAIANSGSNYADSVNNAASSVPSSVLPSSSSGYDSYNSGPLTSGSNAQPGFSPQPSMPQDSSQVPPALSFPVPELNPPPIIRPDASPPSSIPGNSPSSVPGGIPDSPMNSGNPGSSQVQVTVAGPGTEQSGLSRTMQRFTGPNGVLIFVLHARGSSLSTGELTRSLAVQESSVERLDEHTTIGLKYSGTLENVVKQIQFGKVSFVDEDSRSIHVQAN